MYNGENKTALGSQKAFSEVLVRLLDQKRYADISVSELCQESGLSRQTFYTLFQNKENVLRYAIEHMNCYPDALEVADFPGDVRNMARVLSMYADTNYDFLRLLFRQELIYIYYECCRDWLIRRQDTMFPSVSPEFRQYVSGYLISTFTGVISIYLSGPRKEPAFLEELFRNLLSGAYF